MSTKTVIERYIQLTNEPGSPSFPLFGDSLEWLEVHSGRRGGQRELFSAMRESRAAFTQMRIDVLSLIVEGDSAALEARWSGHMTSGDRRISVPMVYIFGVRDGVIIKEIDYVIMPQG
jgi:hypothetical protein